MTAPLEGQVGLVTGGGRGLGFHIARALADEGMRVAITGRDAATLDRAVSDIGGGAIGLPVDVTDGAGMKAAADEIHRTLGPVDFLVNNAGIGGGVGTMDVCDPDEWRRVIDVNVVGPFLAARAVLPAMRARKSGRIVHMGSYVGLSPGPAMSAYAISKAALLRLNDSLALEVADDGLVSIAVSPGWVRTDMTRDVEQILRDNVPGWSGIDPAYVFGPEAVAGLVVRIARGEADALNGRFLHVKDDLDETLAQAERIREDNLLTLGLRAL